MNDQASPTATANVSSVSAAPAQQSTGLVDRILSRFTQSQTPFEIVFPDGRRRSFGDGPPSFTLTLRNRQALRAFASMDEGRVGDAYVAGHVDIEGDMLRPFEVRRSMGDRHYAVTLWRFLQPLLFGQVRTNRKAISDHYDIDSGFFLSFLDRDHPMYTQGIYSGPEDTLAPPPQEVRLLLREAWPEARRPHPRDRSRLGSVVRLCLAARGQVHRPHHFQGIEGVSRAPGGRAGT